MKAHEWEVSKITVEDLEAGIVPIDAVASVADLLAIVRVQLVSQPTDSSLEFSFMAMTEAGANKYLALDRNQSGFVRSVLFMSRPNQQEIDLYVQKMLHRIKGLTGELMIKVLSRNTSLESDSILPGEN